MLTCKCSNVSLKKAKHSNLKQASKLDAHKPNVKETWNGTSNLNMCKQKCANLSPNAKGYLKPKCHGDKERTTLMSKRHGMDAQT